MAPCGQTGPRCIASRPDKACVKGSAQWSCAETIAQRTATAALCFKAPAPTPHRVNDQLLPTVLPCHACIVCLCDAVTPPPKHTPCWDAWCMSGMHLLGLWLTTQACVQSRSGLAGRARPWPPGSAAPACRRGTACVICICDSTDNRNMEQGPEFTVA
jgi:hypothetical protein